MIEPPTLVETFYLAMALTFRALLAFAEHQLVGSAVVQT